jgi:hypothetical protein
MQPAAWAALRHWKSDGLSASHRRGRHEGEFSRTFKIMPADETAQKAKRSLRQPDSDRIASSCQKSGSNPAW